MHALHERIVAAFVIDGNASPASQNARQVNQPPLGPRLCTNADEHACPREILLAETASECTG